MNLQRRHIDASQRAMVAARVKPIFEAEAKARQLANLKQGSVSPVGANLPERDGRARDQAAAIVNISPRSVEHACKVLDAGAPELIDAVDSG